MNVRTLTLVAALVPLAAGSAASAQPVIAQTPMYVRTPRSSDRNLAVERRRLEAVIDGLQRDNHDYGGHREQAIDLLQRARQQLDAAIEYDRTHAPG